MDTVFIIMTLHGEEFIYPLAAQTRAAAFLCHKESHDAILIKMNPENANQVNYISDRMVFILDNHSQYVF